jgi:hypothetical protein
MDFISFTRLSNQQKVLREALRVKESYPRKVFNNDTEFINVHYSFRFEDLCDLSQDFLLNRKKEIEAETRKFIPDRKNLSVEDTYMIKIMFERKFEHKRICEELMKRGALMNRELVRRREEEFQHQHQRKRQRLLSVKRNTFHPTDRFFDLEDHLIVNIYEFDPTHRVLFEKVIHQMKMRQVWYELDRQEKYKHIFEDGWFTSKFFSENPLYGKLYPPPPKGQLMKERSNRYDSYIISTAKRHRVYGSFYRPKLIQKRFHV